MQSGGELPALFVNLRLALELPAGRAARALRCQTLDQINRQKRDSFALQIHALTYLRNRLQRRVDVLHEQELGLFAGRNTAQDEVTQLRQTRLKSGFTQ